MNNARVSHLGDRTYGTLAVVSLLSGAACVPYSPHPVHLQQSLRVQFGATYGNLPTLFSAPIGSNIVAASISRRGLSVREQAVVRRAIARTGKFVSKGRLVAK
jgi:hypothetical protein